MNPNTSLYGIQAITYNEMNIKSSSFVFAWLEDWGSSSKVHCGVGILSPEETNISIVANFQLTSYSTVSREGRVRLVRYSPLHTPSVVFLNSFLVIALFNRLQDPVFCVATAGKIFLSPVTLYIYCAKYLASAHEFNLTGYTENQINMDYMPDSFDLAAINATHVFVTWSVAVDSRQEVRYAVVDSGNSSVNVSSFSLTSCPTSDFNNNYAYFHPVVVNGSSETITAVWLARIDPIGAKKRAETLTLGGIYATSTISSAFY